MSFFDDHLIPCPSFKDGLFRLAKFLYAIKEANLRISPTKSRFFVQQVEWLGIGVTAGHTFPADKHIEKVKKWPVPISPSEISSFLGLAGYHRKYIKDYAKLTRNLTMMSNAEDPSKKYKGRPRTDSEGKPKKPKIPFEWTPECQKEFDYIKDKLTSQPVLVHPNFSSEHPFILNTDASDWALGAELSQKQEDGSERAIAYASKLLSPAERNYSTTRKELLAVVHFIYHFKYYLLGRPFIVRTDHSALQWMRTSFNLTGQLYRWSAEISDYDFEIQHRPGRKHQNADALSRYPYPGRDTTINSALTDLDKEMYAKCGIKPPKSGSLGKKLHADVYVTTRSRAKKKASESNIVVREEIPFLNPAPNLESTPAGDLGEDDLTKSQISDLSKCQTANPRDQIQLEHLDPDKEVTLPSQTPAQEKETEEVSQMKTHMNVIEGLSKSSFKANPIHHRYNMKEQQRKDATLRKVFSWVQNKTKPLNPQELDPFFERPYAKLYDMLRIIDGKLYVQEGDRLKLCIPSQIMPEVIKALHQHPLAGHMGINKTIKQAHNFFYWPHMNKIIEKAIKSCAPCIKAKVRKPQKHVPMGQTSSAPKQRLRHFYADLVGPWLPQPLIGRKQYLLTLIDAATGYPEAYPIAKATTEHVIKALARDFIPRYGVGMMLTTDNGRQFTSELFKAACSRLGVITAKTQPYEPHTNPVERLHKTIENAIRAQMAQDGNNTVLNWDTYVPAALAAIRQNPSGDNKYSPHYLMFGEHPVVPAQLLTDHLNPKLGSKDTLQQIESLKAAMEEHNTAKYERHLQNKKNYDKKVTNETLEVGDWVFVHQQNDPSGLGNLRKTSLHRRGPYEVAEIINERQVRIYLPGAVQGQPPPTEVVSRDRLYKAGPWDLSVQQTPLDFTQALREKNWDSVPSVNNNIPDVSWSNSQFERSPTYFPSAVPHQECQMSHQVSSPVPIVQNTIPDPHVLSEANKPKVAQNNAGVQVTPRIVKSVPDWDNFKASGADGPLKKEASRAELLEAAKLGAQMGAQKVADASQAAFKSYFDAQPKFNPSEYPHLVPRATYDNRNALVPAGPTKINSSTSPAKVLQDSATSPQNVIETGGRARELPVVPSARYMEPLEIELDLDTEMMGSPISHNELLLQNQRQHLALQHQGQQQDPAPMSTSMAMDSYRFPQTYQPSAESAEFQPRQWDQQYPQLDQQSLPQLGYQQQDQQQITHQSGQGRLPYPGPCQKTLEYKYTYPVRLATREVVPHQEPSRAWAQDMSQCPWDSRRPIMSHQEPRSSSLQLKRCNCGQTNCSCDEKYQISGQNLQHRGFGNHHQTVEGTVAVPQSAQLQPQHRPWNHNQRQDWTSPDTSVTVQSPGGTYLPYHTPGGISGSQASLSHQGWNPGDQSPSGSFRRPLEYTGETQDKYPVVPKMRASQYWPEQPALEPNNFPRLEYQPSNARNLAASQDQVPAEEPLEDLSPDEDPCPRAEALRARRDRAKGSWKYERVEEPEDPDYKPKVSWKPKDKSGEKQQRFAKQQANRRIYRVVKEQGKITAPVSAYHVPLQHVYKFAPGAAVYTSAAKYWKTQNPQAEKVDPASLLAKERVCKSAAILEDLRTNPSPGASRRKGLRPRSPPRGSFSVFVAEKPAEGGESQYRPVVWAGSAFLTSGPASV